MKCPHCGRELQDNETFCPGCGWRVERNTDAASSDDKSSAEKSSVNTPNRPTRRSAGYYNTVYPSRRKEPFSLGRLVRAVVAVVMFIFLMFGCQTCVQTGYMTSLMMQAGVDLTTLDEETLLNMTQNVIEATLEKTVMILLVANLLTILILCLLFHLRRKDPAREMGIFSVNPLRLPTFALFGAALNVFVSLTLSMLPLPESLLQSFDAQYSSLYGNTNVFVEILSVAVVAGIMEELIYRGIAMSRLKPVLGTAGAVIFSAILFGVSHGTPIAVAYAVVLGIVFALLYNAFESVVPTIVCHVCFNATSYALALVPSDNPTLLLGLYVLSIAAILWCVYRMFIRRPTFNDMIADRQRRIKPINAEEARIVTRLHEIQKTGMIDEKTIDEVEELQKQWEENRKRKK